MIYETITNLKLSPPHQAALEHIERALDQGRILIPSGTLSRSDVDKAKERLTPLKLQRGEPIGISLENTPASLTLILALVEIGILIAPLSPTISLDEKKRLWNSVRCRFAVNGDETLELDSHSPLTWPDDIFSIMFSSGSTGMPKAIPYTYSAMMRNATDTMKTLGDGTNLLHVGGMSYCASGCLYNALMIPLLTEGRILTAPMATAFGIRPFVSRILEAKPDVVWINPTILSMMMRLDPAPDLSHVKALISCTAPLRQEDAQMAEKRFGCPIIQSYGLSETLIVSLEKRDRNVAHEFSSGIIVSGPGTVTIGPDGTITIRNGAVGPGYASFDGETLRFQFPAGIPNESFVSADLGTLDGTGRLTIVGRTSNVINVEGFKISAEQVEEVLLSDAAVSEAAVAAIMDGSGREKPHALVRLNKPTDLTALGDLCAQKLGPKARPEKIREAKAIPRTDNGKIDRPAVTELLRRLSQS